MIVYMSMDAEGISGIYKLSQVMSSNKEYEFARRMMANDINAAAEGAFKAGATRVIVNDAHNYGDNLLIDQLDERIELISGGIRDLGMAQGAELCADAALLIGYHRRKGAKGVISHSYAYGSMVELSLNGKIISEHDLVGHCIGYFGTPVVFLSGDDLTVADAKDSIPGVYSVITKTCISNNAALCYHPKKVARNIAETVEKAVKDHKNIKPLAITGEISLDVRYSAEIQARLAGGVKNAERLNENTVRFSGQDYLDVYKAFMQSAGLAGMFRDDAYLYL